MLPDGSTETESNQAGGQLIGAQAGDPLDISK